MSYDVHLVHPVTKEPLHLDTPHHCRGGTYALGGTTELWLNITYNYAKHFNRTLPGGIRGLYGKSAAESIPLLDAAISHLGDDVVDNYWEPSEGNAKAALLQLRALALLRPGGVWQGD